METEASITEPDEDGVRFEDLTVDDDLPIVERLTRYSHSQVALQRLVHVKMLAEAAELAGGHVTRTVLLPAMESLVTDPESVIRQHVAAQLLSVSIVCMIELNNGVKVKDYMEDSDLPKRYHEQGYEIVTDVVVSHLNKLIADPDLDVRRAAATAMAGLALQLQPEDVPAVCLPVPLRLVYQKPANPTNSKKKNDADQRLEELRITSANLLAELGGAASEHESLHSEAEWVGAQVLPAVLELCDDPNFRVRRSGVQALPRILGACSLEDVSQKILPMFDKLSQDGVHRIRKSSGECLVDMSRSVMILAARQENAEKKKAILELRRSILIPVADRLIQDSHKMVRQGMMQFLGPFIASFYPYQFSPLRVVLPSTTESDGSNHMGIAAQFFPHATSMVSRLNSSQSSITTAPTPVHTSIEQLSPPEMSDVAKLKKALPPFIHAGRMSALSLAAVTAHRKLYPPDPEDIDAICDKLLDYFAALALVTTGDDNTDAEMRVYCAYSLPAIVLLLGEENWEGPMKTCFFSLLNPNYAKGPEEQEEEIEPPLPVKRCLASSLHTVAHVLSPKTATDEIFPVFQDFFLKDLDESVRLNVIRNFPSLLEILPPDRRRQPFLAWSEVVRGEDFLGAKKRSATNPLVLNWRQRDYLARSLPEVLRLVDTDLVHDHLWPILKELFVDAVSIVRDDALWSIPMLLNAYCPENMKKWPKTDMGKDFSGKACSEVVAWLNENILKSGAAGTKSSKPANFSQRQLYCRACATVGLALRFSDGIDDEDDSGDPISVLTNKFRSLFVDSNIKETVNGPYQKLSAAEQKHLKRILVDEMLRPALAMKEDRISNVRVTLMKVLQLMPDEVKSKPDCKQVLQNLIEEVETWESFGPEPTLTAIERPVNPDVAQRTIQSPKSVKTPVKKGDDRAGPIDLDEVVLTPQSSHDEDDVASPASPPSPRSPKRKPVSVSLSPDNPDEYKTVIFEEGPIGMQLEPTVEDRACRVFSFLDSGPEQRSPARKSGLIEVGDVIVSVNGVTVESYEETISILKAGGRREIVFRRGRDDDAYEGYGSNEGSEEDDDREKKKKDKAAKKAAKAARKAAKDAKKEKKEKKEKKPKKDKKKDSKDDDDS